MASPDFSLAALGLPGECALFGFSVYVLFMVWRRLAARWINWFPLAAKLTRVVLYLAAAGIAIYGASLLMTPAFEMIHAVSVAAGLAVAPLINKATRGLSKKEKIRRGAAVASASKVTALVRQLPKAEHQDTFSIGGVPIPRSAEPYHFAVTGSTGSGKSVLIAQLLDVMEARGDTVIVVDSGGDFSRRYYQPGRDHIINPFDARCEPWSPTAELKGPWDAEALAKSMIPDGTGDSKEWNSFAQTMLKSILTKLMEQKRLSIKDLLYYGQVAPIEELEVLLAGTSAAAQLTNDRTFGSIRTILTNYLSTYSYLVEDEDPFSITKFIENPRPGFLFFSYQDSQLDSLRNMIACAIDVAARNIMSLPDSRTRRIWFVIDEFASIGKVQSIEMIATKARKKGCCLLIGLQTNSQLRDRYGELGAQTIMACLNTSVILRCTDAETAESMSKFIGEAELSRMTRGESSSESGGSASLNEQINTHRAIMPAELQRLANLQGYLKLQGDYPVCAITLQFPRNRENIAEAFTPRDFDANPMLSLLPATVASSATAGQGGGGGQSFSVPEPATQGKAVIAQAIEEPTEAPTVITKGPAQSAPSELESFLLDLATEFEI